MFTDPGIRLATAADLDALVDVHRQAREAVYRGVVAPDPAWPAAARRIYADALASPGHAVFCIDRDTEVVALAYLTTAKLVGLYVRPDHWRHGLGARLHDRSVQRWQADGVHTARLDVWDRNQQARAFYSRRGWRPDGHSRPGPGDTCFLRLTLTVPLAT
ncbi:N-acetyltransferase family protein [Actinoplanes sp. HUAS TT8]|uniref:GNAT family N-acetyltransferase n=1 Tax=Actinoplanes sp. HUAS TT8 TaxID=3447453 RepID=UPI003F51D943